MAGKPRRVASGPSKAARTGMIRARVEPALKVEAEAILRSVGLSSSEAVRLLYKQVVLRKGLPFDVRLPNATTRRALRQAEAGVGLTPYPGVDEIFLDAAD